MKRQDLKTGTEFRYTSDIEDEEASIPKIYTAWTQNVDVDDVTDIGTVALPDWDVVPLEGPTSLDEDIALAFDLGVGVLVGGCTADEAVAATLAFPGEDKVDPMWGMVAGITGFPAFPTIDPEGFDAARQAGERIADAIDCTIADLLPGDEPAYDEGDDDDY